MGTQDINQYTFYQRSWPGITDINRHTPGLYAPNTHCHHQRTADKGNNTQNSLKPRQPGQNKYRQHNNGGIGYQGGQGNFNPGPDIMQNGFGNHNR
ncbi:uncharacterized protein TOL2_C40575 [Desulfobacula toluolica Tol2]|uniref:Uncharacterized protein n=1 Tax=Desulfobacula toluolica (strain DSM 7467 / Tol2) TaxID=651182 RepID=K0NPY2_DESTT|nr:uncharacterized protein TOL2_C40575 [Desulfobacula toluolica Tol2]